MKNWNVFQLRLDTAAISLSAICLAQCLIVPVATIFAPTISLLPLADESFHIILLLFVLPVSILAMTLGCKKHKTYGVMYMQLGLALMAVSAIWGHDLLVRQEKLLLRLLEHRFFPLLILRIKNYVKLVATNS